MDHGDRSLRLRLWRESNTVSGRRCVCEDGARRQDARGCRFQSPSASDRRLGYRGAWSESKIFAGRCRGHIYIRYLHYSAYLWYWYSDSCCPVHCSVNVRPSHPQITPTRVVVLGVIHDRTRNAKAESTLLVGLRVRMALPNESSVLCSARRPAGGQQAAN